MSTTIVLRLISDAGKDQLTRSPSLYGYVQRSNKVREDGIDFIETCKNIYYVGARIRIFLWKDRGQKGCDGLSCQPRGVARDAGILHQEREHLLERFLL